MGTYSQLLQNRKPPVPAEVEVYSPQSAPPKDTPTGNDVASNIAVQQASNIAIQQATNIARWPLGEEDIAALQESTYKPQTFRLSESEVEWLKDTAYRLSKELKRGRVNQVDILRVGLRLFNNLLATNKAGLIKTLEEMK